MAVIGKDIKQPREVEDRDVDFGDWMPAGDRIDFVESEVRLLSGDNSVPLLVDRVDTTELVCKVWLSGGADGARYRVQVRVYTLQGRIKEAEFDITCKEI